MTWRTASSGIVSLFFSIILFYNSAEAIVVSTPPILLPTLSLNRAGVS
jgi:hypothetical protein